MKTVCCVMLANGREAMVRRAVRSFQEQTYDPVQRLLLILDTGSVPVFNGPRASDSENIAIITGEQHGGKTIGALRNIANECVRSDIFIHFDSDDWSHPNRIAEQVAFLEASGRQAVGYKDLIAWREPKPGSLPHGLAEYDCDCPDCIGGAWKWQNLLAFCGTSLCYYREAWERRPFADAPKNSQSTSEYELWRHHTPHALASCFGEDGKPRLIASIHGANTMDYSERTLKPPTWTRAPEWDAHCREVMAL